MNFFILCTSEKHHSVKALSFEILEMGHTLNTIDPTELIGNKVVFNEKDIILNRVSGISYSDEDLYFLNTINAKVYNNPSSSLIFRDKYLQYNFYLEKKIPTVQSYCFNQIESIEDKDKKYLIKPLRSNQARGITLYDNLISLKRAINNSTDDRYLIQPLITRKAEWRPFIINSQIKVLLKKRITDQNEMLNCSSAVLENIPVNQCPQEIVTLVSKIAKSSKLHYMAIDIIEDMEGKFIVLETNSIPGLRYASEYGHKNLAKELILSTLS